MIGITVLLLDSELNVEQCDDTETVGRSEEPLLISINGFLDFSKIELGKLELECVDFELGVVVEDAVDLHAKRAQSKGLE